MTSPELPADRPIPDTTDLRLLAELINNVSIPLAYAAWNARMSQAEAAARLVSMAERGLPLRLVADGDRQALWHIAQAGPATGGVPVAPQPVASQSVASQPVAPVAPAPSPVSAPSPIGALPPPAPVPPHEQAIAGAVPLGQPPFGQPEARAEAPADRPGTAAGPGAGPGAPDTAAPDTAAPVASGGSTGPDGADRVPDDRVPSWGPGGSASWARADEAAPRWERHPVSGPSGEQLTVTLLDVVDPGDRILTDAGFHIAPGRRAVLVHSTVQNTGQVHYYPVGDLYLVLEAADGQLLGRASVAVASHPAFPVGVAPGRTADGWSVFLIPSGTALAGLKWCIRPDMPQTIVGWPIVP